MSANPSPKGCTQGCLLPIIIFAACVWAVELVTLTVGSLVGFTPTYSEFDRHGNIAGDAWMHQHYPHIVLRMAAVALVLLLPVIAYGVKKGADDQSKGG